MTDLARIQVHPAAGYRDDEGGLVATTRDRQEKGARNQALFRYINERIAEITAKDAVPESQLWDFLCECNADCAETVSLRFEEYEALRGVPRRFPVKPGHHAPDIERLVETNARYATVEDVGQAAVTPNPRRAKGGLATSDARH
jgi:hypothetical protein